jgi:XTP/dITP diphosphohydrolase
MVLASSNRHKAEELARLLPGFAVEPYPGPLPPETGETFRENALLKARHVHRALGGGVWVLADDSGIAAAALDGAPGVRSARYAGESATDEENLAKLLREVPDSDRRVAYVCAVAYAEPGGVQHVVEARCEGMLTNDPRGDGGFGYDPAFVPVDRDDGRTMAELTPAEKDAISHRGRAARAFLEWLAERGGTGGAQP